MNESISTEEIHKEIDLIQSSINRMANTSVITKGWMITIYAVIFALLSESANILLLSLIMLVITWCFWYLDAFFLQTEKQFRKIYSWVLAERPKGNRELLYELDPSSFKEKIAASECICHSMFSKTLLGFYMPPLIIQLVIFIVNLSPIICELCKLINA